MPAVGLEPTQSRLKAGDPSCRALLAYVQKVLIPLWISTSYQWKDSNPHSRLRTPLPIRSDTGMRAEGGLLGRQASQSRQTRRDLSPAYTWKESNPLTRGVNPFARLELTCKVSAEGLEPPVS